MIEAAGRQVRSPQDILTDGDLDLPPVVRRQLRREVAEDAWYKAKQRVNQMCPHCEGANQSLSEPSIVRERKPGVWAWKKCFFGSF